MTSLDLIWVKRSVPAHPLCANWSRDPKHSAAYLLCSSASDYQQVDFAKRFRKFQERGVLYACENMYHGLLMAQAPQWTHSHQPDFLIVSDPTLQVALLKSYYPLQQRCVFARNESRAAFSIFPQARDPAMKIQYIPLLDAYFSYFPDLTNQKSTTEYKELLALFSTIYFALQKGHEQVLLYCGSQLPVKPYCQGNFWAVIARLRKIWPKAEVRLLTADDYD